MITRRWRAWVHPKKQGLLMLLLGGLVAMEFLENGMFVFGSSHILGGIGAAPREFAQVQAAYAIGSMLMIALQQWLSRHFGYRNYLLLALLLFAAGDIASASANALSQITAARLVQGMGGGAFFISTRVLIPLMFTVQQRPQATRIYMLVIFAVSAIAPIGAAWLVDNWGWRWVFWSVLPVSTLMALGVYLLMPPRIGQSDQPVQWSVTPLLLFLLAIGCVQWGFSEARYALFERPEQLALLVLAGVMLLGLFGVHQWRHNEPLLHLRDLTNPGFLAGLLLYAVYYFIVNFSNYLFPQFAERGLGIPLMTTGWLNTFSALTSLVVAVLYIRYSARITNKRALMMAGCLTMAAAAWWMSRLPPNAPMAALYGALAIKGCFGVLMVLPVAALTWRALDAQHFAKGYQSKNILRQMTASFASAVAAVALQDDKFVQYADLASRITPSNTTAVQWLGSTAQNLERHGMPATQAHHAALEILAQMVDHQAFFMACQQLYQWLAVVAAVTGVIVLVQKKLR